MAFERSSLAPSARYVQILAGGPVGRHRVAPTRQANSNLGSALSERIGTTPGNCSSGGSVVDLVKAIQREEVRVHVNLAERIGVRLRLMAAPCAVCARFVHAGHYTCGSRHCVLPHGSSNRQGCRGDGQSEKGPCFAGSLANLLIPSRALGAGHGK